MPHINLPEGTPGILGLFKARPETAIPLNGLAEVLLRGPSTLTRGERELIATFVSKRNDCEFCSSSHAAFASLQLDDGRRLVRDVLADPATAAISGKLKALLTIAGQVQQGGRHVTEGAVAAARAVGATDVEIHDTVLIAAAFCMFNRYVDGLATVAPSDPDVYDSIAHVIVEHGYRADS